MSEQQALEIFVTDSLEGLSIFWCAHDPSDVRQEARFPPRPGLTTVVRKRTRSSDFS